MTLDCWVHLLRKGRKLYYVADLMKMSGLGYESARKAAARLAGKGLLIPLGKGLLANSLARPSIEEVACALRSPSYISLEHALFLHHAIAQPPQMVTCMTLARPGEVLTRLGTVRYHHLAPRLFLGFDNHAGAPVACPEKALLDLLYLQARGVPLGLPGSLDSAAFNLTQVRKLAHPFPRAVARKAEALVDNTAITRG